MKHARNIMWPKYTEDTQLQVWRENAADVPPKELFIGLGWDKDKDSKTRHYRRFYTEELENVKEIIPKPSPFNSYDVKRGQTRGAKVSFWKRITNNYKTDASGQVDTQKSVGRFKAIIEVESKDEKKEYLETKAELIDKLVENLK